MTTRRGNLWLADTLWKLGAIQFGEFTLGHTTVNSPIYVNLRLLISHPTALWRAAHIIHDEILTLQAMRHPQVDPFDLVAGVPFGGLLIAEAYSLTSKTPLIYLHPRPDDLTEEIEGLYQPGQTALVMDDLITGGHSIVNTTERLREAGLTVRDAVVLLDRQQGGRERLHEYGVRLVSILTMEVLLNYLMSTSKISEEWYRRSMAFLEAHQR
ncbi:MAG TPA: phosphoribosyltransferase [Dehalococcoidia bacterium]|nr:phosphoribosyltransferase [Dehalococcoidia bacterium]